VEGMDQLDNFTVLIVESEASLRRVISLSLKEIGMRVLEAPDMDDARGLIKTELPDLLILELDFPHGHNGKLIELFRRQKGENRGSVMVMTTQRFDEDWRRKHQPDVTLFKPFDIRLLCKFVSSLLGEDSDEDAHYITKKRART
jgi:DNA-binding response OmpR family regulator